MSSVIDELRYYLEQYPDFQNAFQQAFMNAKDLGVEEFKEINSFADYINFYQELLTWVPKENKDGTAVYNRLCMFYFVIDLPPVKDYQTAIEPKSGEPKPGEHWTWLSQWLISYAQEIGKFMDSTASLTGIEQLNSFYDATDYGGRVKMEADYGPADRGGWKTFNEFFARKIKDERRRPIAPAEGAIASPADARFGGWWPITSKAEVIIKGLPWNINQLLQDSVHGKEFEDGFFLHSFLSPTDYHRQHAPIAGKVIEAKVVPGLCYLQAETKEDVKGQVRLSMKRLFDFRDDPGYQFLQARGVVVIDTGKFGLVAVCPVGMAQVSSVKLSVKQGDVLKKGDEISYFQMGGSDVILLFQKNAKTHLNVTATVGTHYEMGQEIATVHE